MPGVFFDPVRPLFRHCPGCARAGFADSEGPALTCTGCGFVFFLNPAVAAAAFICDSAGRVLLLRRAKAPAQGKLAPPGGFIDKGETAESALRREISEETGLVVSELSYLTSEPNIYEYKGVTYSVLDLFFVAKVESLEIVLDLGEASAYELREIRSIDLDELAFPSLRRAFVEFRSRMEGAAG